MFYWNNSFGGVGLLWLQDEDTRSWCSVCPACFGSFWHEDRPYWYVWVACLIYYVVKSDIWIHSRYDVSGVFKWRNDLYVWLTPCAYLCVFFCNFSFFFFVLAWASSLFNNKVELSWVVYICCLLVSFLKKLQCTFTELSRSNQPSYCWRFSVWQIWRWTLTLMWKVNANSDMAWMLSMPNFMKIRFYFSRNHFDAMLTT